MAISRSASFILIGFVSTTLVIFALGRIFNTGRFLHMNIELALLGAHLCLIPDVTGNEVNTPTTDYNRFLSSDWLKSTNHCGLIEPIRGKEYFVVRDLSMCILNLLLLRVQLYIICILLNMVEKLQLPAR